MAGWLTDWLIELGFTLVMHWLTEILYNWLYLFEGWWCNTDLRAYKVYSLTGQCITSMKTFHQYELNTIKIGLHSTTTRHTDQISWPFLPFWKTGPCWDRKVAFCRAVAVSGGSTVYHFWLLTVWNTDGPITDWVAYWLTVKFRT